jgi:hypothetical protein
MLAHVSQMERQEREIDQRASREGVRGYFDGCSLPELKLAARELRDLMDERMEDDPQQAKRELAAFRELHPELWIEVKC